MKKLNLYNLFFIFVIGSVFGWVIEGLWTFFKKGLIINHSAVAIGPFNMVYGVCAVMLTTILYKHKNDSNYKLFFIGFIGGTIIEYVLSIFIERYLGFPAWNYSKKFMNINGRVCLPYSLFWGVISIIWIKYIYPVVEAFIQCIDQKKGNMIIRILTIFLVMDFIFTDTAITRARDYDKGIPPQNSYEKFLDNTFNRTYLKNMYNDNWK